MRCPSCGAERGTDPRPDCLEEKIRRCLAWNTPREARTFDPYNIVARVVTGYYADYPADLGGEA